MSSVSTVSFDNELSNEMTKVVSGYYPSVSRFTSIQIDTETLTTARTYLSDHLTEKFIKLDITKSSNKFYVFRYTPAGYHHSYMLFFLFELIDDKIVSCFRFW